MPPQHIRQLISFSRHGLTFLTVYVPSKDAPVHLTLAIGVRTHRTLSALASSTEALTLRSHSHGACKPNSVRLHSVSQCPTRLSVEMRSLCGSLTYVKHLQRRDNRHGATFV